MRSSGACVLTGLLLVFVAAEARAGSVRTSEPAPRPSVWGLDAPAPDPLRWFDDRSTFGPETSPLVVPVDAPEFAFGWDGPLALPDGVPDGAPTRDRPLTPEEIRAIANRTPFVIQIAPLPDAAWSGAMLLALLALWRRRRRSGRL